jgi:stearoyl-CoA desaturase (delta-9 desaturase)
VSVTSSRRSAVPLEPSDPTGADPYGVRREMSPIERRVNLGAVTVPFVVFIATILLGLVSWNDLDIFLIMYIPLALGITVGFHRLFTHRAFETSRPLRYLFAILGEMAVQGPVIAWVSDHRKHHAFTDEEGDPHSPHLNDSGWRGLVHAHVGWLMNEQGRADWDRYAPDLKKDPGMRLINAWSPFFVVLGMAIPAGLGLLIIGGAKGALYGFLWGGLIRMFVLSHVTWSINSVCHFFGKRRFNTEDRSTNVWWLALFSLGEAWHNNHHAFQQSARQGLGRFQVDPSWGVIWMLERAHLAWGVVRISPEKQSAKTIG